MKNKRKKLLILSSASVLGVVAPLIAISQNSNANQPEVTMKKDYVITPNPHKVTYQEGSFILRDKYSLSKTDIDEATALKLSEITKLKGMTLSNKKNDKVTNITLVDITKNDALKNQVLTKHKADFDAKVFEKIDGHVLIIKDGNITVIGKNADALFYGLVTLLDILKQLNGLELRNLVVEDYADTSIRGFIEGYYGIPWSNEDRMSLMRFGGKLKMTSYIFAPKDDPYHGQKWYELYPPEELEKIKEMSHVGNMSKTRFVWTIHPFMSGRRFGANEANFDKDYASMVAKFEQLYSAGIRQFGVLADDVGSVPRTVVIKMMKKLVEWGKQKGDVYDWVFCPAGYTYAWTDMQELNDYDPEFPKEVQIFWTGDTVTGHINRQTLEHFRRSKKRANQEDRRAPLFWLNWPVNDINKKRMLMGKGEVLHNDITPDDLVGAVTNPMQEAEPSKVAIAAVADYTWNIGAFNADKSWANSFRYIDENVPESLNRLSWHMSDPSPNGHRLVLGESENIVNDLTALSANLKTNTALTQSNMEKIVTEMNLVIEASKDVLVNMKNKRFLEQYTPFAKAISANAKAILGFMEAYKDFNEGNKNTGFAKYVQAIKDYEESHLYQHIIISGLTKTEPGSKRLRPFMEELKTKTSELFNDYVFDRSFKGIQKTTYSTNIKTASKDGSIENIYDKNPETGILFKGAPRKGDEYKVEYALPRTIYGLHIKQAYPNHTSDYFKKYKVEYTSDGKDWKDIENPGKEYTTVDLDLYKLKLDNVKGIRIVNSQDQNGTWTGLKEFEVDFIQKIEKQKPNKAEIEDLILPKDWTFYNGRKENIYDNNLSSYGWLKFPKDTYKVGDTVAIKLKTAVSEGVVNLKLGRHDRDNDRIKKFDLEYTTETQLNNNTVWTKLGSYENDVTVRAKFKSTSNKPVTFIRVKVNEKGNSWVAFRDFSVDLPLELADDPIISNVIYSKEEKKIVIAENDTKLIFDSNDKTSAHFKTNQVDGNQPNNKRDHILKDSYIGVELETLSKIGKVEVIMGRHDTDDDYMKGAVLEYSIDNKTWTELEKYENQRHIIYKSDLSSEPIKAKYLRLKSTKEHKNWIGIREFKVYGYENNFNTVLLTNKQQSTSQVYANYTLNSGNYVVNPTKNITLKNGEFIKVDLLRNSLLKTVELDAANKDKLTGEYSMNDYLYLPFPQLGANPTINARYIRLQNNTGKDLTFDLQRLDIKTVEYAAPSVIFTNMGAENGNDKTSNLFDMDPTTYMKLKNRQKAGEYTIIDMGREIDLKNLKLVTNDSNKDYIRDADIYISTTNKDGDEGWEKVMSIGDGKPDADSDDKILVSFPKHEVSYNTVSNEKINKKARYIKIKMTADYYGRWSQLNEVVWNYEKPEQDYIREYINDTNNRNFLTNTSDLFKNRFYMYKDEDLNTSYISKEKTGTMDWLVSDKETIEANYVKIVAKPNMNAKVSAVLYDESAKKEEVVELGKLPLAINDFHLPAGKKLFRLRFDWNTNPLEMIDVVLFKKDKPSTNKKAEVEALKTKLNSKLSDTSITPKDLEELKEALKVVDEVTKNDKYGEEVYAQLLEVLNKFDKLSKDNLKADKEALKTLLTNNKTIFDSEKYYTRNSYLPVKKAKEALEAGLSNDNLTVAESVSLMEKFNNALKGLAHDKTWKDKGKQLYEDVKELDKVFSGKNLEKAKPLFSKLKEMVSEPEKNTPQNFEKVVTALLAIQSGKNEDTVNSVATLKDSSINIDKMKPSDMKMDDIKIEGFDTTKFKAQVVKVTPNDKTGTLEVEYNLISLTDENVKLRDTVTLDGFKKEVSDGVSGTQDDTNTVKKGRSLTGNIILWSAIGVIVLAIITAVVLIFLKKR